MDLMAFLVLLDILYY